MANACILHITDNAPMKLEKDYICWTEMRWHIPKKSPYPRLTTGFLVSNAEFNLR